MRHEGVVVNKRKTKSMTKFDDKNENKTPVRTRYELSDDTNSSTDNVITAQLTT